MKNKLMIKALLAASLLALSAVGCASTEEKPADAAEEAAPTEAAPAEAAPAEEAPADADAAADAEAGAEVEAAQPDKEKFLKHAKEHIKYPSNKAAILEACANTPEFTAGEKKWVADNLAEGDYADADALMAALKWAE
jgi:hypothetical protein